MGDVHPVVWHQWIAGTGYVFVVELRGPPVAAHDSDVMPAVG